jgi:hypothetical protein
MTPMEKAEFLKYEGRRYAHMSRAPLKKQGTSDAWNERQNRLVNSRMAVGFLMEGIMLANKTKKENEAK